MGRAYKPTRSEPNIDRMFEALCSDLIKAPFVDTGHWQAKKDVPQTQTRELINVAIELPISSTAGAWAAYIKPNLPWAEDHFKERISGLPLNPPPSHVDWPYNQDSNKDHMEKERFSHTYPERLWSVHAPMIQRTPASRGKLKPGHNFGIRYEYGDLSHAIMLLMQEPYTRQCFIPIWFPEDLCAAAVHHQRVPCTLGYHMMLRGQQLHCFYPMRSLDLLRYFRDDSYMAGRLVQWIIEECRKQGGENSVWHEVQPGTLTMHTVSLHIFENDIQIIRAMKKRKRVKA